VAADQPKEALPPAPASRAVHSEPSGIGSIGHGRPEAVRAETVREWRFSPARVSAFLRGRVKGSWRKPVIGLVVCALLAVGGEVATASTSGNGPPTPALQEGAYVGAADPAGIASFASATQTDPTIASDYLPSNSYWDGMDGSGGELSWILQNGWSGSPYTLSLGVPMIPTNPAGTPEGTLANGAAGLYDNYFVALGQNLVAAGESHIYLRLGWEFDGGWYAWSATTPDQEADYAAYFRQIVESMRSVPGENFKFVWNPDAEAFNQLGYNVALAYPGNAYVDYIGVDAYDQSWVTPQSPRNEWNETTFPDLTAAQQFAQEQGKPLAIPEWGVAIRSDGHGLGDDPRYVTNMIDWMEDPANNVAYESYFDYDGTAQQDAITDGSFPRSLAAFTYDFNTSFTPPSTTTTTTTTTTTPPRSATTTLTTPAATTTTAPSSTPYPIGTVSSSEPSGMAPPGANSLAGYSQSYVTDFSGTSMPAGWNTYDGVPGGDPGAQFSPAHVVVSGGLLQLNAYQDPAYNNEWVTGGVSDSGHSQTYGAYFVRSRMTGAGPTGVELLWPANNSWPPEVDFNETKGVTTSTTSTVWYGAENMDVRTLNIDMTQWHTWGVIWTPTSITYTVDGQVWATVTASSEIPNIPMTLDLQEQTWCSSGFACPSTPQSMDVDWVAEYSPS
jgi:beta-glucanase (GH16 family)